MTNNTLKKRSSPDFSKMYYKQKNIVKNISLPKVVRVGTDCSGIEAPIQALKNLKINYSHEFSSEIDKYAIESIMANYNPKTIWGDITKRNHSLLPDIDLYVCGFPCQPFSLAGNKKGLEDERGNIFKSCVETIQTKLPKYFVLENVKGLVTLENGSIFKKVLFTLNKNLGKYYFIDWKILNTKNYGIPQSRDRIFIVGRLKTDKILSFNWPTPLKMKSLERFIDFSDTRKEEIPPSRKEMFKYIPKDAKFIDLGFTNSIFTNSNKIAPCITTKGLWCVPMHRNANIRELLSLQGFPKNFKQVVSETQMKKKI